MPPQRFQPPTSLIFPKAPQPNITMPTRPPTSRMVTRMPTMEQFNQPQPPPPVRNQPPAEIPKQAMVIGEDGNPVVGNDGQPLMEWDVPVQRPDTYGFDKPIDTSFHIPKEGNLFEKAMGAHWPILSRLSEPFANYLDAPKEPTSYFEDSSSLGGRVERSLNRELAAAKAGIGQVLKGSTQMGEQIATNPINLGAMLLTGGASATARAGMPALSKAMTWGARGLSAPVGVHGYKTVTNPELSFAERAMGLAELAGGAAGVFQPYARGPLGPTAPPKAIQGEVLPPDIPPPNRPSGPKGPDIPGYEMGPDGVFHPITNPTVEPRNITPEQPVTEGQFTVQPDPIVASPDPSVPSRQTPAVVEPTDVPLPFEQQNPLIKPPTALGTIGDNIVNPSQPSPTALQGPLGPEPPPHTDPYGALVPNEIPRLKIPIQETADEFVNRYQKDFVKAELDALHNEQSSNSPEVKQYWNEVGNAIRIKSGNYNPNLKPSNEPLADMAHADYLQTRIREANELGINPLDYDNPTDLNMAIDNAQSNKPSQMSRPYDSDEPLFSRNKDYDPSIGGDARSRGMGTFQNALINSSDEELTAIRQVLVKNLEKLKGDVEFAGAGTGMAKRRIGLAQNKLAAIDEALTQRMNSKQPELPLDEPSFARSEQGGIKIGVNVAKAAGELTTGYSGPLEGIMVREAMQNAIDAIRDIGSAGKIKIALENNTIIVTDNGKGMDRTELETVFSDLHSSGKTSDASATGGKGIGKATYMLGGAHFQVKTVKNVNGQKIQLEMQGTPGELMINVDPIETIVPNDTPTGTTITTKLKAGQDDTNTADMFERVVKYSRDIDADIELPNAKLKFGIKPDGTWGDWKDSNRKIGKTSDDKTISTRDVQGNGVNIAIPKGTTLGLNRMIKTNYLNNGMYQFSDYHWLDMEYKNLPSEININIKPFAEEGTDAYPFPTQRESLKTPIQKEITALIDEVLVNPERQGRKSTLRELYNSMPLLNSNTRRKSALFDPGQRLTPKELLTFQGSKTIKDLTMIIDSALDKILTKVGDQQWADRLEGIGIVLDRSMHGVHIPNPDTGKSTILINPFEHIETNNPSIAAMKITVTHLHEVAHIGTDTPPVGQPNPFTAKDLADPRIGTYLASYLEQTMTHGGLDQGHGLGFIKRLGKIYEKFGTTRTFEVSDDIQRILTDQSGGYSSEVSELLSIYLESRGRPETTEDFLSGTGIKSKTTGTGQGNIPGANRPNGTGTSDGYIGVKNATPAVIMHLARQGYDFSHRLPDGTSVFKKTATGGGSGGGKPPGGRPPILETPLGNQRPTPGKAKPKDPKAGPPKASWMEKAFQLPRSLMASTDLSAPLRQGLPLIHKKEFWTALKPMIEAWGSEAAYAAINKSIYTNPKTGALFNKRTSRGKEIPSFAEDAGLKLMNLDEFPNAREEALASIWAETGGDIPIFSKAYRGTLGNLVRRGNRAYTTFLNKLRADTFASLIDDANIITGENMSSQNLQLARDLANFVNTASGRGSLGPLEQSAKALNYALFAPRLVASRLQMLNPHYYWAAPPQVRKEALKSLFAIAAVGNTITQLGVMAGGEVGKNPNSSDFGKLKIGDTRIDPYAGFQQYIVAANRLLRPNWAAAGPGETNTGIAPLDLASGYAGSGGQVSKSSTTGREFDLWEPQSPFQPTHKDIAERFVRGKLNPIWGFAWGLMENQKEMSGEEMDFTSANPMKNAIMQRFMPIIAQDIYELSQENPRLLPIGLLSFLGMGSQTYGDIKQKDPW